ncbi:MAG: glucose 1-dehydrogenase [bacterium]|nr:glucose 1-dehydrogenase [bacterium]MDE0668944.1 glucose 1-dehydrogenase [bacterium]MYB24150.1 glucose 1-dehydrogenase [Acidimicrobiia bacterium]
MTAPGALVTGGARGIGRAIAERLARRGDVVFIGDLGSTAAATVAELCAEGLAAHGVELDVRDPGSLAAAVAAVEEAAPLTTMVNNAGVGWIRPLVEVTPQQFDDLMSINLRGVFFGIQAAARVMADRGGCIVNTASTSAFTASTTPMVPYDTSKGAVRMLTIAAARELAPLGIRVNAVAPGTVDTALTRSVLDDPGVLERQAAERIPLGRLGKVTDIAAAVDFLSSEAASYVTGHVLVVDGGWLT